MNALSNLLVCGLLQVTLVAAVGLIVVAISGRWSRISAATLSFATLAGIVMLTVLAFVPWPSWLDSVKPDSKASATSSQQSAKNGHSDGNDRAEVKNLTNSEPFGFAEFLSAGVEGLRNLNQTELPASSIPVATEVAEVAVPEFAWTRWFVWLFAAGVLLGMIRLIGGIVGVRLMIRSSRPLRNTQLQEMMDVLSAEMRCPARIEILESTQLATAATVGWRRPVILISDSWKSWSPDQLRCVLAHEIAHIARGDFASTVAAQLGLVLHFYHPLVHLLVDRLRLEQELAADAIAARVVGGSQVYLHAIGELALMQSKEHVSWPAHAFLPTRRTFLRRIEMLRDMKLFSDHAPLAMRVSSVVAVLAVTLAVAGIRPPGTSSPTQAVAAQPSSGALPTVPSVVPSGVLEAKYVPANVIGVAVFRPSEFAPQYRQLRAKVEAPMSEGEKVGIDVMAKCQSVTVILSQIDQPGPEPIGVMMSFADKAARDSAAALIIPGTNFQKERVLLAEIEVRGPQARYFADNTTLIFGNTETVKTMVLAGPSSLSPLTQTDAWDAAAKGTLAIAVDPVAMRPVMEPAPRNPILGMLSPFWMQADNHTLGVTLGDSAELKLMTSSPDEKSAKVVEAALNAGLAMLSGMVINQKASVPEEQKKAVESLEDLLNSKELVRDGKQITLTLRGDATAQTNAIVGLLAPAVGNARQSAQRAQQQNNFKQIMLAMHNYHDVYGHFPAAVVVDPASGAKRSWRVELLPVVEQAALYDQYRKDQPWDSDANKAVLAKMPAVFRHPSMPEGTTNSSIFAAVGEGLVFEKDDNDGTKLSEIADGSSNTIAIVEANRDIPWTKPEDIEFDLRQDTLPELGIVPEGWIVGICDGSVRFISKAIDVDVFKKLLTRAGGEVVPQF